MTSHHSRMRGARAISRMRSSNSASGPWYSK